jgi:hypothetical protein
MKSLRNFALSKIKWIIIYIKILRSMFIILVLYVDNIPMASSDKNLLYETKGFLSSIFDMKDFGDATYVLGIEIQRYRTK